MVCLNDIAVNGNLAKIRRHVFGRNELHFLLNQRPFFLCYIEFDLYFSFASVHAIAPFRSEGLGHFPTSNFQPTHRRARGRKYGKGYSFPMLATKLIPTLPTTPRKGKMTVFCKRKTLQSQKRLQRFLNPIQFCRTHLICPLFRLWLFPLLLRSQSVCLYHSYRQGARQAAADWCLSRRGCQKGTGLRIYCNAA